MSLLEILLSLIIFAVLLLGLISFQVASLKNAKALYYATNAQQQIEVMQELLKIKSKINFSKHYRCWNLQNAQLLPQGRGEVGGASNITIYWGRQNSCYENTLGLSGCLKI